MTDALVESRSEPEDIIMTKLTQSFRRLCQALYLGAGAAEQSAGDSRAGAAPISITCLTAGSLANSMTSPLEFFLWPRTSGFLWPCVHSLYASDEAEPRRASAIAPGFFRSG